MARRAMSSAGRSVVIRPRAAASAKLPPEPMAATSFSGSRTSPAPVMTKRSRPSVTISIASRLRRYLSMRQSLASSTQPRANWPGRASSFFSSRSSRVKASAVDPANPATMSRPPGARRRTLRAVPLITVWPRLTCPSPATTTMPPRRTARMVVPCHPGNRSSAMLLPCCAF